jgi:hypothetical protein
MFIAHLLPAAPDITVWHHHKISHTADCPKNHFVESRISTKWADKVSRSRLSGWVLMSEWEALIWRIQAITDGRCKLGRVIRLLQIV